MSIVSNTTITKEYSFQIFKESLKSKQSVRTYSYLLDRFRTHFSFTGYDEIVSTPKKKIQHYVEQYVIHLKETMNPNTVQTYVNPIKLFLEQNDIDLNWRKIKRLYPELKKHSGKSAYQTEDVRKMLDATTQLRNKTIIHFLASTGIRVGALTELKLKHLRDMPMNCKMVTIYEDSTEEYHTFLTPEASGYLKRYLDERKKGGENLTDESPIIRETFQFADKKPQHITVRAIQGVLDRAVQNAGIRGQKMGGRYGTQLVHGLRKRFNTILKLNNEVNDNAIEKMMGHKRGLDGAYFQGTDEQLFDEFSKGITDLTIDQNERQQVEIEKLKEENNANEKLTKRLENIEKMLIENKQYSLKQHEVFHPEVKDEIEQLVNQLQTDEK